MKNANVIIWSVTVALGGFLFGFDTAVISGAEQSIQKLWLMDDFTHGLAVAIALYGTVIGALFGGIPANKIGRKNTLFWIAVLYLISALGSALAPDQYTFMFFRFIGGLGVGASSVVAPMYISEVAPTSKRGRLVALFQFNIVLGILIAYVSNYFIQGINADAWRWMIGIEAIPALGFLVLVLRVPKSPRWLITNKGDTEQARQIFAQIDPDLADESVQAVKDSWEKEKSREVHSFFSNRYRFLIALAFLIAAFNQMSGINAIIYYAPRILGLTGLGESAALFSTMGIGLVNLIFTMTGMALIDKMGRRSLMYLGSVGLIVILAVISYSFYTESFGLVPIYLGLFIAFFALSQGAVIWVFISEIFPNKVRAQGQSLGSFTHWTFAAIVANIFPFVVNKFDGGPIFLFFSIMMFLQLLFVWKIMPETKGISLEEIEEQLASNGQVEVENNKEAVLS